MAATQLKFLLMCVCILVLQTTTGVYGQCSTPPINQAVYEGTPTTEMTCSSPTKVSWTSKPTSEELVTHRITNYTDVVASAYTNLFGVNSASLIVKIAQGDATIPPISTAGLYVILINGSTTKYGAKLSVVRQPPTCNCSINSTKINITCNLTYADSTYHPINAKMTWTSNGNFFKNDTPVRSKVNANYYVSTSVITVDSYDPANYQCTVTFAKPTNIQFAYVATNYPAFSATCTPPFCRNATTDFPTQAPTTSDPISATTTGVYGQCSTPPINQAVYEGTPNTEMTCNSPTKVSWTSKPTTDELSTYKITNYDDIVTPAYTNLFDVNSASLIIKTAQGNATTPPISTAGLYVILINGSTTKFGAKLTVVRQPPTCDCTAINSTQINMSCSLTYADSSYHPINAKMTWTSNGTFYTNDTPVRRKVNAYYLSTSVIIIDASDPADYQCTVTFAHPISIQFPYVATNAPAFSATCTLSFCGNATTDLPTQAPTTSDSISATTTGVYGQCSTPPINQAVYEGTPNTEMTCNSPTKVSWTSKPTTDELGTYKITNYDDIVASSLTDLFGVNSASLIIKTAQGNATTPPISTAGLYIILINGSTTKFGAKLTVVRQPPTCDSSAFNSTQINMSCSLTYADSVYHPINAKMTWTSNGNFYVNDTPVRTRVNPYYVSTSVITVDAYDPANYQCTVIFAKPTNIQLPYVATNAPVFSATCNPPYLPTQTPTTSDPISATTTECNCTQTASCPSPDPHCIPTNECSSDGTSLTNVYDECVVKAELYARCDKCCPEDLVCGVVVTLRNDSRWLIHDSSCDDNKCEMAVVGASCMSSDWKLLTGKKITISGVGDYVQVGNSVYNGLNMTDCSDSCSRMMNLM